MSRQRVRSVSEILSDYANLAAASPKLLRRLARTGDAKTRQMVAHVTRGRLGGAKQRVRPKAGGGRSDQYKRDDHGRFA